MSKEDALRVRVQRELDALRALQSSDCEPSMMPPQLATELRKLDCRVESEQMISASQWEITVSLTRTLGDTLEIKVVYSDCWSDAPQFYVNGGSNMHSEDFVNFQRTLVSDWDPDFFAAACFPYLYSTYFTCSYMERILPLLTADTAVIINIGCAGGALEYQFFPPRCHRLLGTQQPPVLVRESLPRQQLRHILSRCCSWTPIFLTQNVLEWEKAVSVMQLGRKAVTGPMPPVLFLVKQSGHTRT
jgi:hypothetical protein